jgi:hypothetical protein
MKIIILWDVMWSGKSLSKFRRNLLPPSSEKKCEVTKKQSMSSTLVRNVTSTRLHGIISRKIVLFIPIYFWLRWRSVDYHGTTRTDYKKPACIHHAEATLRFGLRQCGYSNAAGLTCTCLSCCYSERGRRRRLV